MPGFDLDKLRKVVEVVKAANSLRQAVAVEEKVEGIGAIIEELEEIFGDGFQWSDFAPILGTVVPSVMDLAKTMEGKSGEERKQFAVDCIWTIYKYYDPNIPLLPEPFETKLEKVVVERVAEAAIEAVYKFGKKQGYWGE
jgi:hypothetical protein